jgi:hypothetical protein
MPRRVLHILWFATLLGLAVMVFDRVFGGLTSGLKTGLGKSLGV